MALDLENLSLEQLVVLAPAASYLLQISRVSTLMPLPCWACNTGFGELEFGTTQGYEFMQRCLDEEQ
jgi:hypothetical protein